MTLTPFLSAPSAIQLHLVAAILALALGPFAVFRTRRDRVHKVLGYSWIAAMATLALSAFLIPSHFGPFRFNLLHVLAIVTLWSLWSGLRHALRRDFGRHQAVFRSLYLNGLIIAGVFTLMPGRTINRMVFSEQPYLGWIAISLILLAVAWRVLTPWLRRMREV